MRVKLIGCALLLLCSCAKGSPPASPVSRDGGETDVTVSCGAMEHKLKTLYQDAAELEGVAPNLRSEYISANIHMVISDCQLSPAVRTTCLQQAKNAQEVESKCLEYLDDQGTVEGYRFSNSAP
jgi:hypothetical protein